MIHATAADTTKAMIREVPSSSQWLGNGGVLDHFFEAKGQGTLLLTGRFVGATAGRWQNFG